MKKLTILCMLGVFILSFHVYADQNTILVIESYHEEYPWDISYKKGIRNILGKEYKLVFFQMDTKRLPPTLYAQRAQLAWDMYRKIKPVLVILGDDNALKFIGPRLAKESTPAVFLGINNNPRDYGISAAENITGVLERPLMKRSILYLSELLNPKPKKILILFDSGITSQISVHEMFDDKTSITIGDVQVDLKLIRNLSEWKKTVLSTKLNGYGAIVVGLYQTIVDDKGNHVKAIDIINWTSENTTVPPFGFWDFTVGPRKTIGGLVLFGQTQGEAAAQLAKQILDGKNPNEIPPVTGKKGRFFFSRSQLEKWDIILPDKISAVSDFMD